MKNFTAAVPHIPRSIEAAHETMIGENLPVKPGFRVALQNSCSETETSQPRDVRD